MNLNKRYALIAGINKIIASANEEQKDAETYDKMRVQSGIIAACVDAKYLIENGAWKEVSDFQYEYETYKEMVAKAHAVDPWRHYYRGKAKGYKMIVDLLSSGGENK